VNLFPLLCPEILLTRLQNVISDLTRLFLSEMHLDLDKVSNSTFPSLKVLGMLNVSVQTGSTAAKRFPALRHLAIHDDLEVLEEEDIALLESLAPQLHSVALLLETYHRVKSEVPSLQAGSTLLSLPWNQWKDFSETGSRTVNLRLLVWEVTERERFECTEELSKITDTIQGGVDWPELESLYLPPFECLPPDHQTEAIVDSLRKLDIACQQRGIKIVLEEQSDRFRAESLRSEEFMRRMTKKRINSEGPDVAGKDD